MLGSDASAPYLATAPLQGARRARRRWRVPVVVAGIALGAAALTVLIAVPVAQSAPESFTIANPHGSVFEVTQSVMFPHSGTFVFTWQKVSGSTPTFTFTVLAPAGGVVYESNLTAGGAGTLRVGVDGPYTFEILDWLSGTVTVSGVLHYSAPLL
ncbi:MAG TPA: hypothetical protein VML94_02955 [Thermoplasmata archaeon]|nr:hypothetical protein [Thermoplasmata archaeon]